MCSKWLSMGWAADALKKSQWREGRGESQGAPGAEGVESPRNRALGVYLPGAVHCFITMLYPSLIFFSLYPLLFFLSFFMMQC